MAWRGGVPRLGRFEVWAAHILDVGSDLLVATAVAAVAVVRGIGHVGSAAAGGASFVAVVVAAVAVDAGVV